MTKGPEHIAIILDGNRRYATKHALEPWKGQRMGAERLEQLIEDSVGLGVRELTFYTWSIDNFERPKQEVSQIMDIFREEFEKLKRDKRVDQYGERINFIGRLWLFPEDIQALMREIMEKTAENSNYTINFAVAYDGRSEIVDTAKKLAGDVSSGKIRLEDIDETLFRNGLYLPKEPDMIIRTGGEMRLSDFLTYQSGYSELFFVDKLWPEFTKGDLLKCIEGFKQRERRFGK